MTDEPFAAPTDGNASGGVPDGSEPEGVVALLMRALALLEDLDAPLSSSTLILPGEEMPLTDPYEMRQLLEHQVDLIIDGGYCGIEPTTVVDLEEDEPRVLRIGQGDASVFEGE